MEYNRSYMVPLTGKICFYKSKYTGTVLIFAWRSRNVVENPRGRALIVREVYRRGYFN